MKHHTYLFFLLLLAAAFPAKAQNALSPAAEISVLTCDPGQEMYSAFGHSAIRIHDPFTKTDMVFNYGTFDFRTPNFYMKFAQGKLDYMLSISHYEPYIQSYREENRSVREQVLNLNRDQKYRIFSYLMNNARPENKYYRYDFFFDNCATRVFDVIYDNTKEEIELGSPELGEYETFRLMLRHYINHRKWLRFGINTLIGLPADQKVSKAQASFLPDYLENILANSTIEQNEKQLPLVKESRTIFKAESLTKNTNFLISPSFVFSALFLIVLLLSVWEVYRKKNFHLIDRALFFLLGITGLLISAMWFLTEHDAVVHNLNIVWAFPLHLIPAFMLTSRKRQKFIRSWLYGYTVLLLLFLGFFIIKMTFFDPNLLPILLLIMARLLVSIIRNVKMTV